MNKQERITAVVVTYNRKELLEECLNSLLSQTRKLDGIILIDNASTDGTEEMLKEKGYLDNKIIDYVKLSENTGGAGGFHEGVKRGYEKGFDWLWLMDDDTIPEKSALHELIESNYLNKNNTGALASMVKNEEGELANKHTYFNFRTGNLTPVKEEKYTDEFFSVDISTFVGFLVRREVIRRIGFPNKNYFFYQDDTDYSLRLRKEGFLINVIPKSIIIHKQKNDKIKDVYKVVELWKYYYAERNGHYTFFNMIDTNFFKLLFIFRKMKDLLNKIIKNLKSDKPLLRSSIVIQALIDGLTGRMGKRIDPVEFRKKFS